MFYDSDFDHKGQGMPVLFSCHVEFLASQVEIKTGIEIDLKLRPVTLTDEQVVAYELPLMPDEGKLGGAKAEEEHGGMVELDALEALHPGVMGRLHEEAFAAYRDDTLESRLVVAESEANEVARQQWDAEIAAEMAEVESVEQGVDSVMRRYRGELQALYKRINTDLKPYRDEMEAIVRRINAKAEDFDPELPERPVAEVEVDEHDEDWLLDLSRDYLSQIDAYRKFKGEPPISWRVPQPDPSGPRRPRRKLVRIRARRRLTER